MNCAYKGVQITSPLYGPLRAKNGHFNELKPICLELSRLVASGKITGRESVLAFRAEKENKPLCFGCYSGWEACPATRRGEWGPECKLCKKLSHLKGDKL